MRIVISFLWDVTQFCLKHCLFNPVRSLLSNVCGSPRICMFPALPEDSWSVPCVCGVLCCITWYLTESVLILTVLQWWNRHCNPIHFWGRYAKICTVGDDFIHHNLIGLWKSTGGYTGRAIYLLSWQCGLLIMANRFVWIIACIIRENKHGI